MQNLINNSKHRQLQDDLQTFFREYGFIVELNFASTRLRHLHHNTNAPIDLYCHSKPFTKEVKNGDMLASTLASDFLIECKTGTNLNDKDKKSILEKSKIYALYVAYPKDIFSTINEHLLDFFHKNGIGILTIDADSKRVEVVEPALSKRHIETFSSNPSSTRLYKIHHELFSIFSYMRGIEKDCILPFKMTITNLDGTSYEHELSEPKDEREFIGIREKFIKIFEKEGYEVAESWAIFTGLQERPLTFQGFNIQSLIFAFNKAFENTSNLLYHRSLVNSAKHWRATFNNDSLDWLRSSWHNDDFVFCICARKDSKSALLWISGDIGYYGLKPLLRFNSASIFCDKQFGQNLQSRLNIQSISQRTLEEKRIPTHNIQNEELTPILPLISNYTPIDESCDEFHYFYRGEHGIFVISNYDYCNAKILAKRPFEIEPLGGYSIVTNYVIDSIVLKSPVGYNEVLQ